MRALWILSLGLATCSVGLAPAAAVQAPTAAEKKVTLNLKDVPFRAAMELLFAGSSIQYTIDPGVPNTPVNLSIRDRTLTEALDLLVQQAAKDGVPLVQRNEGGIYRVGVRRSQAQVEPGIEGKVTLNLKDVPLRSAIQLIFEGSGLQYSVDPVVQNVPISLSIRDISRQAALRLLVRQASTLQPGLTVTREGEIFVIRVRPPAIVPRAPEAALLPPSEEPVEWEKIPVRYLDAEIVAEWLGGDVLPAAGRARRRAPQGMAAPVADPGGGRPVLPPDGFGEMGPGFAGAMPPYARLVPDGIHSIFGVGADNSLLVQGAAEDVQVLRSLIRMIDLPQRQLRVRVSAGRLSSEGQVLNGQSLQLSDTTAPDRLTVTVVPRLLGDGTIEITLDGSLASAGAARPLRSRVRLSSGQAVPVMTLGEGMRQVKLTVRAEVLPESAALGGEPVRK